jgi:starch synthase (maltosyl-transferring)
VRHWELDHPESLRHLIARVNRIRADNPALQQTRRLRFLPTDNDQLLAFSKASDDGENMVVVVVNLDPHHGQSGWIELPLADLGLPASGSFQVHDLLSDARYFWNGPRNFVELDPRSQPGHVFRARQKVRTEQDFDYFL